MMAKGIPAKYYEMDEKDIRVLSDICDVINNN